MTHIQQRRGLASDWTAQNPVLWEGESGHETDTGREKMGDGVTAWNDLDYKFGVDSVAGKTGVVILDIGDVGGAAPLFSPDFSGYPTAPTEPNFGDDSERVATTGFVQGAVNAGLFDADLTGQPTAPTPPANNDSTRVATTAWVKDQEYAPLASPALVGTPTAPTPAPGDNDTSIATTAFVQQRLAQEGQWVNYAPSFPGITIGNGNRTGRYVVIGDYVHFWAKFVFGSTSAMTTNPQVGLPFPAANPADEELLLRMVDTGVTRYYGRGIIESSGAVGLLFATGTNGVGVGITATVPFTWTTFDEIVVSGSYEKA